MKKVIFIVVFTLATLALGSGPYAAEVTLGPDLKIPPPIRLVVGAVLQVGDTASAPRHPIMLPFIPS